MKEPSDLSAAVAKKRHATVRPKQQGDLDCTVYERKKGRPHVHWPTQTYLVSSVRPGV